MFVCVCVCVCVRRKVHICYSHVKEPVVPFIQLIGTIQIVFIIIIMCDLKKEVILGLKICICILLTSLYKYSKMGHMIRSVLHMPPLPPPTKTTIKTKQCLYFLDFVNLLYKIIHFKK